VPTITVAGVDLFYTDTGTGQPIILVHGAAGSGAHFDAVLPTLADHYRVIVPDLRGMGRSGRVRNVEPDTWCNDLRALLDSLGLDVAHLVGVSLGSRVAARFAVDHPSRVGGLVVDAPIIAMEPQMNTALNANLSDLDDSSEAAQRWRQVHGADWREVVQWYFGARNDPALQDYLSARPFVADMQTPTLITRGDIDDPIHPLAHALEWHHLLPSSWLWIEPDAGASVVIPGLRRFNEVLEAFLAKNVSAAQH
jgi:pimeloyl-ACP methyl ester carboxylesterase